MPKRTVEYKNDGTIVVDIPDPKHPLLAGHVHEIAFKNAQVESFFFSLSHLGRIEFLEQTLDKIPPGIYRPTHQFDLVCWRCSRSAPDRPELALCSPCQAALEAEMAKSPPRP